MEKHLTGIGSYIKDIVYGANDGIITTFAVVAGSFGANLSPKVILILGFANLLADGFSMAASNYLGTSSEHSLYSAEKKRETEEVERIPEKEKEEIRDVFLKHNFSESQTGQLVDLISQNKNFWIDFMMKYELEMNIPGHSEEWKAAALTFTAFVIAGTLPLLPFIFLNKIGDNTLFYSAIFTAISLFAVGASRRLVTQKNWFWSGMEMLIIGGIAASVAYWVGYFVSVIVR